MADSTSKPFAIFRLTAAADTEALINNREAVGMDIGLPDGVDAGLVSFKPIFGGRRTDVGNPDQTAPSSPDTGIVPPFWELDFIVNEKVNDSKVMAKFQRWMLEDKESTDFPKGRMAIRYDAKSWGDIFPELPSGGKLVQFEFLDDITWGGLVHCKALILFAGNPTTLLAQLLAFIDAP